MKGYILNIKNTYRPWFSRKSSIIQTDFIGVFIDVFWYFFFMREIWKQHSNLLNIMMGKTINFSYHLSGHIQNVQKKVEQIL